MERIVAALDANILFRRYLRDLMLFQAMAGLFEPRWSEAIVAEALRPLVARGRMTDRQAADLRDALWRRFEAAWITVSDVNLARAAASTRDPGDAHVLATALETGAGVIVTENLVDFPANLLAPHGVDAMTADAFLAMLIDLAPGPFKLALETQQTRYRNPPMSMERLLDELAKVVPEAVRRLR